MNEPFKKVIIATDSSDVEIKEGEVLSIDGGNFSIKDGVLNICSKDDISIVIPVGEYESFEITTISGNLAIEAKNCHIHTLTFNSNSGDAEVSADINNVDLKSDIGVCSFYKANSDIKGLVAKTRSTTKTLHTYIKRVNNERYD